MSTQIGPPSSRASGAYAYACACAPTRISDAGRAINPTFAPLNNRHDMISNAAKRRDQAGEW